MLHRWLFLLIFFVTGCSHFQGPGSLHGPGSFHGPGKLQPPGESSIPGSPDADLSNGNSTVSDSTVSTELDTADEFATPQELYASGKIQKPEAPIPAQEPFRIQWPVDLITINRGFTYSGRRAHLGLDLGGRRNTPIHAAHDGVVVYAGSGFRGFGKMIILEYDNTWATLYGHLNKFKVKTGARVERGQIIGFMGRTGRATGVHLHFEVMKNKSPIDPMKMLSLEDRGMATAE